MNGKVNSFANNLLWAFLVVKPKTIVIDLDGVFEGDDTRLRIASSQQIYWDQAYITADEPPVPIVVQELELQSAELNYRGFGRLLPRADDQPDSV